jgi:uncharacterized membrane protein HdeD (DUF308 family)
LVLLEGIAAIIIGLLLLSYPAATILVLIQFLGLYWLVKGIFGIVLIFLDSSEWGWKLFMGIIGILAGIVVLQLPLWSGFLVTSVLVVTVGLIALVMGVINLIQAFRGDGWGVGILGVLSILLGILLLTNLLGAILATPFVLGLLALFGGVLAIFGAFQLKTIQDEVHAAVEAGEAMAAAAPAAPPAAEEVEAETVVFEEPTDPQELAKFQRAVVDLEGVEAGDAAKLNQAGIHTTGDLLRSCASRPGRERVAAQTGISESLILKWTNFVDLYRIRGVGPEYSYLLEATGVDTVVELAQRNPENLNAKLGEVNEQKQLVERLPGAAEVVDWVDQAKTLPRIMTY